MEKNRVRRKKQFAAVFAFGSMLMTFPLPLQAAERIHSAYFSPALNSNDPEVVDFAYQYLHANSEASLYPEEAVKNLIRMSGYMDKKLASIDANKVLDLSLLDELGTKRHRARK
jgi:hypothetical protein